VQASDLWGVDLFPGRGDCHRRPRRHWAGLGQRGNVRRGSHGHETEAGFTVSIKAQETLTCASSVTSHRPVATFTPNGVARYAVSFSKSML
jgi:hypothetical protein